MEGISRIGQAENDAPEYFGDGPEAAAVVGDPADYQPPGAIGSIPVWRVMGSATRGADDSYQGPGHQSS